jgi:glycosyltransferase involved in cell wall biosynthesis
LIYIKILLGLAKLKITTFKTNNVLLVTEAGCSGGTRTYLFSLLEFLYSKQIAVTVLINGNGHDNDLVEIINKYSFNTLVVNFDFWCTDFDNIPKGVSKRQLRLYQANEILFWISILQKHKFSKIIFNVAYSEMFLYAFLLPAKIKYILHSVPEKKADTKKRFLLNYFLNNRKEILTVSQYASAAINLMWIDKKSNKHIHFIHNYYEPEDTYKNEAKDLEIDVLTIGNVVGYKNPSLFVKVAEALNNNNKKPVNFVWAGDGVQLNEFRDITVGMNFVKFIGFEANVEGLYKNAKVYYQPSLMESHGIAVLGAMFNHIPCVVSDRGGLRESCIDGKTGFVVPVKNENKSIEKINFLLNNEDELEEMGRAGKQYFEENFSKAIWMNEMTLEFKSFLAD